MHNHYTGTGLPGLTDSLFEIEKAVGQEVIERWDAVSKELARITYFVHAAANYIKDFDEL